MRKILRLRRDGRPSRVFKRGARGRSAFSASSDRLGRARKPSAAQASAAEHVGQRVAAARAASWPRCSRISDSAENAEKVVKPPRKPVTSSSRSSSFGRALEPEQDATPISRPPTQLTNSVPSGKPAQRAFSHSPASPAQQRADDRAAPTTAAMPSQGTLSACPARRRPGLRALPAAMPQRASAASSATRASTQRAPSGVCFLLPERRLRLQVVHQELAGLEGLAAVRRGDGDQHDLAERLPARRPGGRRARRGSRSGASPRRSSPRSPPRSCPGSARAPALHAERRRCGRAPCR